MEVKKYSIYHREAPLRSGVAAINSTAQPLTALRVMVEGLGAGDEAGLWLTHVTVIPMVPRIAPFDLIYLDREARVVERVELLPATEIPRFRKPAESALILPFHTISSAQIERGEQLVFEEMAEVEDAPPEMEQAATAPAALAGAAEPTAARSGEARAELASPFLAALGIEQAAAGQGDLDRAGRSNPERDGFALSDFLRPQAESGTECALGPIAEPVEAGPEGAPAGTALPFTPRVPRAPAIRLEAAASGAKAEPVTDSKKPIVNRFFRWLYPALYDQNRRASIRRESRGLVAYRIEPDTERMYEVADLSSHGFYLRTDERWAMGAQVSLLLQRRGPRESDPREQVQFEGIVVRTGSDGMGFSFALPPGMELGLWEAPGRNGADEADPGCILRELRMARALAFVRHICPPASAEATELLHKSLSNVRAANVVEIALKAERLLMQEPNAGGMAAHPDLTLRILQNGSWAEMEWLQELWAGLLATSCTLEGRDESNLVYINLLSQLAPLPTQILTLACGKAMQAMAESASVSPALFAFSAEEIARITRSTNLTKIYKSIAELSELGLVEKNARSASFAKAKPTHLALELYARCHGVRGAA